MRAGRIAVFGATGTSAGSAARKLIETGWEVRAVTRDVGGKRAQVLAAMGATAVAADIDDRAIVRAAIEGCDAVYFAGPSLANRWDIGQAVQGINVADAAAEVGSGTTSSSRRSPERAGACSVSDRSARLKSASPNWACPRRSRPALFMDNFLTYFPPQERDGTLVLAMALPAEKPQAMVSAEDIGRAAAAIADDPRP